MGAVLMPFLGNQCFCSMCTQCAQYGKKNRERRGVCSCRVTILLKYRYSGIAHTAAVLQWMNKCSLGVAGQGGKSEGNQEAKSLPGIESGCDIKGSQKRFFWYISYKSKTGKNDSPLLTGAEDVEKGGIHNTLFSLLFTYLQKSQAPEASGKMWSKKDLPSLEKDQTREYLNKLDTQSIHEC